MLMITKSPDSSSKNASYFAFLVVETVAVLFARFGSKVAEVTVAVLAICGFPVVLILTVNVRLVWPPLLKLPRFQVTAPPEPTCGALVGFGDALT